MAKARTNHLGLWILWIAASGLLAAWLAHALTTAPDKTVFMPGPLTDGHHQLADRCDVCHGGAFGGGEVLQEKCVECHGDQRVKPLDSHPRSKFKDPRNADRLEKINALVCTTCHVEHKPEITAANGLTEPRDLCVHCHENVAEDRPSHEGMPMDTCATAGCHNFHNNRALYTDFLIKHLHEPAVLEEPELPTKDFAAVLEEIIEYPRDRYPVQPLSLADTDAPTPGPSEAHSDWLASAHARSGVNCSACHVVAPVADAEPAWSDHPGDAGCTQCHQHEVKRFGMGKHGMRLAAELPPMTPAQARLPMKDDASHDTLSCTSCHGAHRVDVQTAAVDACLGCHSDEHSLAYEGSPHHELWQREVTGSAAPNTGVSCASCHMPRIDYDVSDWLSRVMVDHNQNANLSPNTKMIRPACGHCHGLDFALNALTDPAQVATNFRGEPGDRVDTMRLAEAEKERREKAASEDDDAGMFGF